MQWKRRRNRPRRPKVAQYSGGGGLCRGCGRAASGRRCRRRDGRASCCSRYGRGVLASGEAGAAFKSKVARGEVAEAPNIIEALQDKDTTEDAEKGASEAGRPRGAALELRGV